MSRILFAAHPTAGHTNALRAIGGRLREQGHATAFAIVRPKLPFESALPPALRVAGSLADAIARDGFEVFRLRPPPGLLFHALRLPFKTGLAELEVATAAFTSGLVAQAREIAGHLRSWKPDVVVADYLMGAAALAAALERVPCAAVYHSGLPFPARGAAPFGSGLPPSAAGSPAWLEAERTVARVFAAYGERLAEAARRLGAPAPANPLTAPASGRLNLLTTVPALEPGLAPLAGEGPVAMIGPCLSRRADEDLGHPALRALPSSGLRVYVSLGTVFNGKPRVFATLLDGLAMLGAHVVVSAGASLPRLERRRWPNTHLFAQVPQLAVLRQVDVVVTHGGNNTVQECLASGRPLVVLPFGSDQHSNAQRVERLGVGRALDASRLAPEQVRDAVAFAFEHARPRSRGARRGPRGRGRNPRRRAGHPRSARHSGRPCGRSTCLSQGGRRWKPTRCLPRLSIEGCSDTSGFPGWRET
ncbi:MAG: glycosyltransferase [Myxococcales bacterium]